MSKQLGLYVEGVVSPISAFAARKARFREELLAHLQELVRECNGNEAEAIRRFGDATLIRQELQRSVPWTERLAARELIPDAWFVHHLPTAPKSDESPLQFGIRVAGYVALAQLAFMLMLIGVCTAVRGERLEQILYLGRPIYFAIPLVLVSFLSLAPLLAFGVAPGCTGSQVFRRGLSVNLWMVLLMGGFVQFERAAGVMTLNLEQFVELAAILCLAPIAMYLCYRLTRAQASRAERWHRMIAE